MAVRSFSLGTRENGPCSGTREESRQRNATEESSQILVCLGGYGGQGYVWMDLHFEDFLTPSTASSSGDERTIFTAFDNSSTCGWNPQDEAKPIHITLDFIERVDLQTAGNGAFRGLSVFGSHGERDMSVAQVKACTNQQVSRPRTGIDFGPPTKPYRIDFRFDGKQMVRVSASPGAPK
jgi:hypothetical protein